MPPRTRAASANRHTLQLSTGPDWLRYRSSSQHDIGRDILCARSLDRARPNAFLAVHVLVGPLEQVVEAGLTVGGDRVAHAHVDLLELAKPQSPRQRRAELAYRTF